MRSFSTSTCTPHTKHQNAAHTNTHLEHTHTHTPRTHATHPEHMATCTTRLTTHSQDTPSGLPPHTTYIKNAPHNIQRTYEEIPRAWPLVVWMLAKQRLPMRQRSVQLRLEELGGFACPPGADGRGALRRGSVFPRMFDHSILEPRFSCCASEGSLVVLGEMAVLP